MGVTAHAPLALLSDQDAWGELGKGSVLPTVVRQLSTENERWSTVDLYVVSPLNGVCMAVLALFGYRAPHLWPLGMRFYGLVIVAALSAGIFNGSRLAFIAAPAFLGAGMLFRLRPRLFAATTTLLALAMFGMLFAFTAGGWVVT